MKIKKTAGAALLSLGLVVGLSGFASAATGSITNTGPDSYNAVKSKTINKTRVKNNNDLNVNSWTAQTASSGEASSEHNTTGGGATSGSAANTNSTSVSATIDNSSVAGAVGGGGSGDNNSGTITQTGPDSTNVVRSLTVNKMSVENNNNVNVSNSTTQTALSGEAEVSGNTTGGSATSGNVSNTNTTSVTLNLKN
jgi:hypothetical protein